MEEAPRQQDMFEDEYDKPRVFRCIGGAFIGTFNRRAAAAPGDEACEPVLRLSAFFPTEEAASAALEAGTYLPSEPVDSSQSQVSNLCL